jgi:predicted acetyltransferase
MTSVEIAPNPDLLSFLTPISVGLGFRPGQQEADEVAELLSPERTLSAFANGAVVGSAGAYPVQLSVPGGQSVPAAAVAYCGVLPTHRRRGILTGLMLRLLNDARERGDVLSALWPSEELIYSRWGFGVGSFCMSIDLATAHASWRTPEVPGRDVVLVDPQHAQKMIAPIYEQVRTVTAGMIERSDAWWRYRRLRPDSPDGGPFVAVAEGVGYAVYQHRVPWAESPEGTVEVIEAVGIGAQGTRRIWQYLFEIDLCCYVQAQYLPVDCPLLHMLAEPRRLRSRIRDGMWVRILDLESAISARHRGTGSAVLAIADPLFESNSGRWHVSGDGITRTTRSADLAVDISDLATVYLGGATFERLARAGRVNEFIAGGVARADAVLPVMARPWTLEVF